VKVFSVVAQNGDGCSLEGQNLKEINFLCWVSRPLGNCPLSRDKTQLDTLRRRVVVVSLRALFNDRREQQQLQRFVELKQKLQCGTSSACAIETTCDFAAFFLSEKVSSLCLRASQRGKNSIKSMWLVLSG